MIGRDAADESCRTPAVRAGGCCGTAAAEVAGDAAAAGPGVRAAAAPARPGRDWGAMASLACAVHCALVPVLIGAGSAGGLAFLGHASVEWGMVLLAAVVGTFSAWRGFRSHGNLAVVALVLLAIGALVLHTLHLVGAGDDHEHEIAWTGVFAGIALAGSLFVNNRLCRSCHTGHTHG